MIKTAHKSLSPTEIREKLKTAFINHVGSRSNQTSLNSLLDYIGNLTKLADAGKLTIGDAEKTPCAPETVLAAARNTFIALREKPGANTEAIAAAEARLDKAFAKQFPAKLLQASLKASEPFYDTLLKALTIEVSGTNENPGLIANLVKQAEATAGDNLDAFGNNLRELLDENKTQLSNLDIDAVKSDIEVLRLESSAYFGLEARPELMSVEKHLAIAEGTSTECLELKDKKAVVNLILEARKSIDSSSEDKRGQAIAKEQATLVQKLSDMSDSQRLYFRELTSRYKDLKASEPNQWIAKLTESLPNLIVPSIIGAVFAYVFGFSANLGAMGAAAMSILGSLASDSGASDAQVQPKQKAPVPEQNEHLRNAA
jgi:hypothetical protein